MWGDSASIEQLAAHCVATADNVANAGSTAHRTAGAVDWHSVAAATFASKVDDFRHATTRCVDEFEHAAELLRRHATTVNSRLEEIHRLEQAAADLLQRGLHVLGL
jgi:uncharacterized protein YukE